MAGSRRSAWRMGAGGRAPDSNLSRAELATTGGFQVGPKSKSESRRALVLGATARFLASGRVVTGQRVIPALRDLRG